MSAYYDEPTGETESDAAQVAECPVMRTNDDEPTVLSRVFSALSDMPYPWLTVPICTVHNLIVLFCLIAAIVGPIVLLYLFYWYTPS